MLDDEPGGFWERVVRHVKVSMPACKFLRRHDSSAPSAGKIYHGWFEIGEHLKALKGTVAYAAEAVDKHEARWLYSHSPFYAAAYVVDPEFIEYEHTGNEEVCHPHAPTHPSPPPPSTSRIAHAHTLIAHAQ